MRDHGTHACYVWGPAAGRGGGCRCDPCRAAAAAYERERSRRITPAYVSAHATRRHVRWLSTQGVGLKTLAKRSGVAHGTLWKLMYGLPGRGSSKRIRYETQSKILAVGPADGAPGSRVPAGPTWAVVDRLLERGWTKTAIARAIGQTGTGLQLGRQYVTRRNADALRGLVDQPVPPHRSRHGLHPVPEEEEEATPAPRFPVELPNLFVDDLDPVVLERGACRMPDVPTWIFYPGRGDNVTAAAAKAVCATCPATAQCLAYAVTHNEPGVWGGTTDKERRAIRRRSIEVAS